MHLAQKILLVGRKVRLVDAHLVREVVALTVFELAVRHLARCVQHSRALQWYTAVEAVLLEA